jgi:S1-C subfamily serine protease
MRFSKIFPSGFKISTYLLTLILGAAIAWGTLRVFSSPSVATAIQPPPPVSATAAIAQAPISPKSFVSDAVDRVGSAVVRLDTERTITRRLDPFFNDPFFERFFGPEFFQQIPQEERQRGQGSGFIIDRSGLILTNAHVVSQADRVTVTLKDGRTFDGEVRGSDALTDLAVVKINPTGEQLPVAPLGNSAKVRVGDWAIALGNPLGLDNTVTLGIISTLDRSSAEAGIPDKRIDFLQTDAAINPGNSGGPLLNSNGEVIGINTAMRADGRGIGFAIPINKAKALKDTLAAGKKVPHPYVGIQMVGLTPELAKQNNEDPNSPFLLPEIEGILVVRVLPNTPAEAAGMRRGDVILEVEGQPIARPDRLQEIVDKSGIGTALDFKIQRGDREINLTVRTAQLDEQLS